MKLVNGCKDVLLMSECSTAASNEREDGSLISEDRDDARAEPRGSTYYGKLGLCFRFPEIPQKVSPLFTLSPRKPLTLLPIPDSRLFLSLHRLERVPLPLSG
jgi:hypothetical protein